jgi:hypothetical protein
MIKVSGLDELTRQFEEASRAFKSLDGAIANLRFDPEDASSIAAAIYQAHTAIDAKAGRYARNPLVAPVVKQLKEQVRQEVLERAAAARLQQGGE